MCVGEGLRNMDHQRILLAKVMLILRIFQGVATDMPEGEQINDSLWLYHASVTWEEASTFCQNMDASLAVAVSKDEDETVRNAIASVKHVWVGHYTTWMYPTGCFTSNQNFTRIENNDVVTCKLMCGDSDIMLNIFNCLCVEEVPDSKDREPPSKCNTKCPGNKKEYCGGNGVYQHYATYTNIQEEYEGNNCGMAERNTSVAILARHCEIRNSFLCGVYDNEGSGRPFYIPTDENGSILYISFKHAWKNCVRNGSYLADPTKLRASQFQPGEPTRYWVGARRVTSVQGNSQCLYMVKGSAGIARQRTEDCSQMSSFLCRIQAKPRTASITGTTVDTWTSPTVNTAELTTHMVTNEMSPTVNSAELTTHMVTNETSPTAVTSEITRFPVTDITTDPGIQEPPAIETDLGAYIGGGAGFLIAVIIVLIIVIFRLNRSRRETTKQPTDRIPLETYNYDYLDIMVTGNQDEVSARAACSCGNEAGCVDCVECSPGPHLNGTKMSDSANKESAHSNDEKTNDDVYDLADNSVVSSDTQTRTRRPYDYVQAGRSGLVTDDNSWSVGNDTYNELHATRTGHTHNTDDMYDHANTLASDECYHTLSKPGHRHKEDDLSAYDTTHNTLDSDVYNTLSNKGSKVNGKDIYNPYVDTEINPLP